MCTNTEVTSETLTAQQTMQPICGSWAYPGLPPASRADTQLDDHMHPASGTTQVLAMRADFFIIG